MDGTLQAAPGGLRGAGRQALEIWWRVAAAAAAVSLFAFPLYKGVLLGLVPVLAGLGLVVLPLLVPAPALARASAWLLDTPPRRWLAAVLLLGAAARVLTVAFPPVPVSDHAVYYSVGHAVADGKGFGDLIFWPPGQPAIVAFAVRMFGDDLHVLAGFHALLGLANVALLYAGLRRYSEPAARWGSLAAAVWPSLVLWNSTLGHETVSGLLFSIILLAVLAADARRRLPWAMVLAIGLLSGALALVRPTALAIPFLAAAAWWLAGAGLARAVVSAVAMFVVMAAVIAPWTARNQRLFNEFCPISANFGNVLLSANHPDSDGIYHSLPHIPQLKPCERDHLRMHQALAAMKADPARTVALTLKRIAFMWGTDTSGLDFVLGEPPRGGDKAKKLLALLQQVPWAALVFAWFAAAWRGGARVTAGRPDWSFALLWMALLWLLHALVEPLSRHHLPLVPLLAAMALPRYWAMLQARRGMMPMAARVPPVPPAPSAAAG